MRLLIMLGLFFSYPIATFAFDEFDASIEAETAFSGSEEARAEADELKRMAKEDKKRRDQMKITAEQSRKEARRLEQEAVREADHARRERTTTQAQIKELQKQIKGAEARQAEAKKRIDASKAEIAKHNQTRDGFLAKRQDADKEMQSLNQEASQFERYVREAADNAVKAQNEARQMQFQLEQNRSKVNKARINAQKRAEIYRQREAHYRTQMEKARNPASVADR